MAHPGPPRIPTAILEKRGSWRAKKRPRSLAETPSKAHAPAWLDAEGKKIWKKGAALLRPMGLLTVLDELAFARYCETLSHWRKLTRFLHAYGETYPVRDAAGQVTGLALYPQVGLHLRLHEQLLKMEQQFGMTPASRASLDVPVPEKPAHGNAAEAKLRYFRFPPGEGS